MILSICWLALFSYCFKHLTSLEKNSLQFIARPGGINSLILMLRLPNPFDAPLSLGFLGFRHNFVGVMK